MDIVGSPIDVRNPDGEGVETQPRAFLSSPLPMADFAVIEAADLNEAIALASKSPCAVPQGVIEV